MKILGVLLFTGMLSACGFALREPPVFNPALSNMYINTATPNDPFVQTLKRVLSANHITVVNNEADATAILNLTNIAASNTMDAQGGIEVSGFYTAALQVDFNVTDKKGNYLVAPSSVAQSQNFTSNATQVLSANLTASQLTGQMYQEIAGRVVAQLAKTAISSAASS